jgi:hypothetical protein
MFGRQRVTQIDRADLYNRQFSALPQLLIDRPDLYNLQTQALQHFASGASSSLIVMSDDVPIGCILWLHPRQQAQHDDIPGLDDNVFKLGAMGLLKPRPCVVIDRLPERSGWVKICCVGRPTPIR